MVEKFSVKTSDVSAIATRTTLQSLLRLSNDFTDFVKREQSKALE